MHIAVDAVGVKTHGTATVLLGLLEAAEHDARIRRITVFASPRAKRRFVFPDDPRIVVCDEARADASYIDRTLWFCGRLPQRVAEIGARYLICTAGGGIAPRAVPCTTLIQQSLSLSAEGFGRHRLASQLRLLGVHLCIAHSCHNAQRIVVQSDTMVTWLSQALALERERFVVVRTLPPAWPAATPTPHLTQLLEQVPHGRRLLYVGTDSPHKNVEVLAEIAPRLLREDPRLKIFATLPQQHALCAHPGIVGLGFVERPQLHWLYQSCALLLMPSLVETVGLPMIEAMGLGLPVLAADRPYAREICGGAASYFDPLDAAAGAQQALAILAADERRGAMIGIGYARIVELKAAASYREIWRGALAAGGA